MARGMKRYRRRKQAKSGFKSNPPLFTDLWEFIGPGFGGFAITRFTTRVAATQISKRWPKMAKHAGAIASVGSFLAAWWGAHRVKWLEKYHTPIVVGSGIAAIQSVIQLYLPRLGWVVSDASPDIAAQQTQTVPVANGTQPVATDDLDLVSESGEGWYTYNDAHDAGRYASTPGKPSPAQPSPAQQAASSPGSTTDDSDVFDIIEDEDPQVQGMGTGIFAQG